MKTRTVSICLLLLAVASCSGERYVEVIDVEPVIVRGALDRTKGDDFDFESIFESFQARQLILMHTYFPYDDAIMGLMYEYFPGALVFHSSMHSWLAP